MNISRSSRHIGTGLSLLTAVLLGSCAQFPSQPSSQPESSLSGSEPPAPVSGVAGPTGPGRVAIGPSGPIPAVINPAPLPPRLSNPIPASERPVVLRSDHPNTYTVVPGDTLWSISKRFLQNPWQWRRIWRKNPHVRNPHRIYPGDVLAFSYDGSGNPQLNVMRRGGVPLTKLSPEIRVEALSPPIPSVPRDAVASFLTRGQVLEADMWREMPYIVTDDDGQTLYTNRDRIYARGANFDHTNYQVFRVGEELREPGTNRPLGVSGIYLGQAALERDGDPASFLLKNAIGAIRAGDRLIALEEERDLYSFEPQPAPPGSDGIIMNTLNDNASHVAQYTSVLINLGAEQKVEPGHVFAIFSQDREVKDPVTGEIIKVPGEQSGLLMVYKIFEQVSYALVMQVDRPVYPRDRIAAP